jgi:class 3 adenylate cyclase
MAAAPSAERRERRIVSVLFADLVGFTSRSERLAVEDVKGFLAPYFDVLRSAVETTGGAVAKFTGDGVMALFGSSVAHEDDPERAVRAGLRICEGVSDLHDGALGVRVGVTTGEVPGTRLASARRACGRASRLGGSDRRRLLPGVARRERFHRAGPGRARRDARDHW